MESKYTGRMLTAAKEPPLGLCLSTDLQDLESKSKNSGSYLKTKSPFLFLSLFFSKKLLKTKSFPIYSIM